MSSKLQDIAYIKLSWFIRLGQFLKCVGVPKMKAGKNFFQILRYRRIVTEVLGEFFLSRLIFW